MVQNVKLASTALSQDGTAVVQTFTQQFTKQQLTMSLSQNQNQLATLTQQIANVNANISNIQSQLGLFPQDVQPLPPQPAPIVPGA